MRGVVSLAAALSIPVMWENGTMIPQRNLILFITFIVILLTLLVQGLTLPYVIKKASRYLQVREEPEEIVKRKLKRGLKEHTYQFLKGKYSVELHGNAAVQKMLQHWEEKSKADNDDWMNEKTKEIFFEMLKSQRQYLLEANKEPSLNEEIVNHQLYLIDLEEERIRLT